jgi:23S rRNA pseudouridine1911/1915/1917 synthase
MNLPNFLIIPEGAESDRADRVLASCMAGELSRSALQRLIRLGRVVVRGKPLRSSSKLNPGDQVEILPETLSETPVTHVEAPDFSIIFEDDEIIVVDKPPGLVVHPATGCRSVTLMEKLIHTRPEMVGVGEQDRWGIVHRLDKDTSGVMVVAKTAAAHGALAIQFRKHSVHRVYLTLVAGHPGSDEGVIDKPLGRHVKHRKRISTHTRKARPAVTRWRVLERFQHASLLEIRPATGRTHQIRVHLASAGLPVLGDQVYGRAHRKAERKSSQVQKDIGHVLKRQALHAELLGFLHPKSDQYVEFTSPLPADMVNAIRILEGAESDRGS